MDSLLDVAYSGRTGSATTSVDAKMSTHPCQKFRLLVVAVVQ